VTKRIWLVNIAIFSVAGIVLIFGFSSLLFSHDDIADMSSKLKDSEEGAGIVVEGDSSETYTSPLVQAAQKYALFLNPLPPPPPPPRVPTPPTVPQELKVTGQTKDSVSLTWSASHKTDEKDPEIKGYKIYQNGKLRKTVTLAEFTDAGLKSETEYKYTVSAYNAKNDESQFSEEVVAKTEKAPPPTPPTVPQDVTVTESTYNSVSLTWSASNKEDDKHPELKGYKVYQNGAFLKEVTGTEYADTELNAETEYRYTVTAVNTDNDESQPSAEVTVKTGTAPIPKPPDPTFTLKGTVVIGEGRGYAIVKVPSKKSPEVFAVGEKIEEYTLSKILDGAVVFEREGYDYKLEVPKPAKNAVKPPQAEAGPAPKNPPATPPSRPTRPTRPSRSSRSR
jgi:chitodextrinase